MAVKKSELYSTLWEACNKLRGGVEPARYKDYVLVLLFHKYVSDRYKGKREGALIVTDDTSFDALIKLKNTPNIGEDVTKVLQKFLIDNGLAGEIAVNFNNADELGSGKELVDKVSGLIGVFENNALDFQGNTSGGDDIIGDAYEYFMMKFAQESGKSKGQFYTPGEVSRIIARLIGIDSIEHKPGKLWTLYDPACGSGSLLIRADDESPLDCNVSIFGQEKDVSTSGLAKMNLVLHGKPTGEIKKGNTLAAPEFFDRNGQLRKFDFIVMNPPFSDKSWSDGIDLKSEQYKRFTIYGTPPAKNGDYAWLLHVLSSLNDTGKAGIVMPHGVLFRGNAEEDIRRKILMTHYIKGIISLPPNLFYGTGIPACIILIDKENAQGRTGIFFIDAGEGFMKDGSKNRLREQDIERIVRVFKAREEIAGYSRFVSYDEILGRNDGNLNVPRYIQRPDAELPQNIAAHLSGKIPAHDVEALSDLWRVSPGLRSKIFADAGGDMCVLSMRPSMIGSEIFCDECIGAQKVKECEGFLGAWREEARKKLMCINEETLPKKLIRELGDDLLEKFSDSVFAGKYDVFDCLMNYWNAVMQDDVYLIKSEGWEKAGRMIVQEKVKGKVKSWEGAVIPREVMGREYFPELVRRIRQLEEMSAEFSGEIEELRSEYPDSEELSEEEAKYMKKAIDGRLKADREARRLRSELDVSVMKKYADLTEGEVRHLVFDVKWMEHIVRGVVGEFERRLGGYVVRVEEMARRYERALGEIEADVEASGREVREALGRMGYVW